MNSRPLEAASTTGACVTRGGNAGFPGNRDGGGGGVAATLEFGVAGLSGTVFVIGTGGGFVATGFADGGGTGDGAFACAAAAETVLGGSSTGVGLLAAALVR